MAVFLNLDGIRVDAGQIADLPDGHELQNSVMPVVSLESGHLRCWGTAVYVGVNWFLTARHVVDDYMALHGSGSAAAQGLFVFWESTARQDDGSPSRDALTLPVVHVARHPQADLAALSVGVNELALTQMRVATLAVRMPQIGEPLGIIGYRHMSWEGEVEPDRVSEVSYERTMAIGVGVVLETQPQRHSPGLRGSPGVVTDAPIHPGMSGGPVLDHRSEVVGFANSSMELFAPPGWNSFVVLAGPALELQVMGRRLTTDEEPGELLLAGLVGEGVVHCSFDHTVDVGPSGEVVYVSPDPTSGQTSV